MSSHTSRGGTSPLRRERRTNYPDLSPRPATHNTTRAATPQPVAPPARRRQHSAWDIPIDRLGLTLLNPDGSPVTFSPDSSGGGD
jgi:hypothetical protein